MSDTIYEDVYIKGLHNEESEQYFERFKLHAKKYLTKDPKSTKNNSKKLEALLITNKYDFIIERDTEQSEINVFFVKRGIRPETLAKIKEQDIEIYQKL